MENGCPLTCLSHILVWHLLGQGPAVHHLTNVLLHAASVVLLLVVLWRMTGRLWPSAVVAAVFAVHPLRAESVAWVTERKDVLCGLFFMLTLVAYLGYVRGGKKGTGTFCRKPRQGRSGKRCLSPFPPLPGRARLLQLGLAAKPLAVTLPFLLLLLDYWPLGRLNGTKPRSSIAPSAARSSIAPSAARSPISVASSAAAPLSVATLSRRARSPIAALWRLVLEKVPMLAIACLFLPAGRPWSGNRIGGQPTVFPGVADRQRAGFLRRLLGSVVLSSGFGAVLSRRPVLPPWQVAAAVLTLAAITAAAFRWRRQRPYLLVGWLWYVGMLVPVIGLVQFGVQAEADRFTYLPQIGLTIALVWTAADACGTWPRFRPIWALAATCGLAILLVSAWRQTCYLARQRDALDPHSSLRFAKHHGP